MAISNDGGNTWITNYYAIPIDAPVHAVQIKSNSIFAGTYNRGVFRDTTLLSSLPDLNESENSLSVYPNPTDQKIKLICKQGFSSFNTLTILNIEGKSLLTIDQPGKNYSGNREVELDVSELPAGIYFVLLTGDTSISTKFVKE